VQLGVATDTYDAEGEVTWRRDASRVSERAVAEALREFVGDIRQRPPAYSAIKVEGKPLYRYAREGDAREAAVRTVHVERITLLAFQGAVAEIEITCGKGTYIRSIAHDLGERLGAGGHLAALRRISSGGFWTRDAYSPEALSELAAEGRLLEAFLAADRAVERRPAAILEGVRAADVRAGRDLRIDAETSAETCRAYSAEGDFLAVLRRTEEGGWHPEKVLGTPAEA
jgi:tRNA pseudouridine55 synthase